MSSPEPSRRWTSVRKYPPVLLAGLLLLWAAATLPWMSSPAQRSARSLRSGDRAKRIMAVADLERYGQEEPAVALAALSTRLKDDDPKVRAAGATAIVRVLQAAGLGGVAQDEAKNSMHALFDDLDDPDVEVRASVLQALWLTGTVWKGPSGVVDLTRIEDALISASTSPDLPVRLAAVRGLGAISPKLADNPPPSLSAALNDNSSEVRTAAAEAHAWFSEGLVHWLPGFVAAFENARPDTRPARAFVFNKIRPGMFRKDAVEALSKALQSADSEVRSLTASALRAFGEDSAQHGYLNAPYSAIPALVRAIAKAAPPLGESRTPSNRARLELKADKQFAWTEGPGPEDAEDAAVSAVRALQAILPGSAFDRSRPMIDTESFAILSALLSSGSPRIRAGVALCLGRLKPEAPFVPVLSRAVSDKDELVRAAALKALHDIADLLPFTPLEDFHQALEDSSPGVRYWAAGALGHIQLGLDPFIPALLRHAEHDPDAEVRDVCAAEIENFIRPTAVSSNVVPTLTEALSSPSDKVRFAACALLGRLGATAQSAIPVLLGWLKESDSQLSAQPKGAWDKSPQECAATALGQIAPNTSEADHVGDALVNALDMKLPRRAWNQIVLELRKFPAKEQHLTEKLRELSESWEK